MTRSKSQNNVSSSLSDLSNLVVGSDTQSLNGGSIIHRRFSRHRPEIQRGRRGDKRSNYHRHNSLPYEQ